MFSDPISLILLLIILSIMAIFLWITFLRFPIFLIALTILTFVAYSVFGQQYFRLELGHYNFFLMDGLSFFLLSIAITKIFLSQIKISKEIILVLGLGMLLFISWIRGVLLFSLESSTNHFRTYLYFFSALIFISTLPFSANLLRRVSFWFIFSGWALLIVVIVRWILVGLNIISSSDWLAPNGWMIRVLPSAAALFILQTVLFMSSFPINKPRILQVVTSIIFITVVVLLLHRTIWVTLIILVTLAIIIKTKNKFLISLGIFSLMTVSIIILLWSDITSLSFTGSTLDLSSFIWRVKGWLALVSINRYETWLDYIIGQPFGTGYIRYITDSSYATTVSPHNFFIQTFLNIGVLGLVTLLVLFISTLKTLLDHQKISQNFRFLLLLSTQLVYSLTYSPSFEQGIILGLALLLIWNQTQLYDDKIELNEVPKSIVSYP